MPFCINLLLVVASGQQLNPGCATGGTLPCHYEQSDQKEGTRQWTGLFRGKGPSVLIWRSCLRDSGLMEPHVAPC